MSVQGVMNTKLSDGIGLYESNAFVQGTAFLLSVVAALVLGGSGFENLRNVERVHLFGGVVGLVITITVMLGMKNLGPVMSVSVILTAQLLTAVFIEAFGLLGAEKTALSWTKFAGIALMTGGIALFKKT